MQRGCKTSVRTGYYPQELSPLLYTTELAGGRTLPRKQNQPKFDVLQQRFAAVLIEVCSRASRRQGGYALPCEGRWRRRTKRPRGRRRGRCDDTKGSWRLTRTTSCIFRDRPNELSPQPFPPPEPRGDLKHLEVFEEDA
jgi:hypothetical protein